MNTGGVAAAHGPTLSYAAPLFAHLPRADQRRWAHAYLTGLVTAPGKKTVRSLAAAVTDSPTASQSLHQFINTSPWEWAPTRRVLADWVEPRMDARAWTVDVALLRKRGPHSCGVHRRFVSSTGRSAVCQLGVGMFLTGPECAVPVDWQLLLPGPWDLDLERRRRVRVPDEVHVPTIEHTVMSMIDNLAHLAGPRLPVVADLSGCNEAERVVRTLSRRGLDFMVAVPDGFRVMLGRRPGRGATARPGVEVSARSLFHLGPEGVPAQQPPTDGTPQVVTVSQVGVPGLVAERAAAPHILLAVPGRRHQRLWLTSLADHSIEAHTTLLNTPRVSRLAVRRLAAEFGMADFEGRSYPGWHHHMTMVSAAYAYCVLGAAAPGALPWSHAEAHLRGAGVQPGALP